MSAATLLVACSLVVSTSGLSGGAGRSVDDVANASFVTDGAFALPTGARPRFNASMIPVRVTVAVGRKTLALEDVQNQKVVSALRQAARDVGVRLAQAKCPTHDQGPTNVQLHFDNSGAGDLKYESCCEKLGEQVSKLV